MIEKVTNFPKHEFVFRSYLLRDIKLEAVKAKFAKEHENLKHLLELNESPLKN